MSRYNHPHKFKKSTLAAHILGGLLCVVLLCLLCPHEATTKLVYDLNEPWDHNALIAKDSFDIRKSDEEIQKERDSLKLLYEPIYDLNEEAASQTLSRFQAELDSLIPEGFAHNRKLKTLVQNLEDLYRTGIMDNEEYHSLIQDRTSYIHKCKQTTDVPCEVERLYSVSSALEKLMEYSYSDRNLLQTSKISLYLQPNLTYNADLSQKSLLELNKNVTIYSGRVMTGEKIVDRGQIVTQDVYNKLKSYEQNETKKGLTLNEQFSQMGGNALYILMIVLGLYMFFYQFRSDYLHSRRYLLLVLILFLLFPTLCYLLNNNRFLNIYAVPYCMLPIFLRVFMDSRTAFMTHLACIMLCALVTFHPFEFLSIQILAGLTAIYSLKQLQERSELFRCVLLVTGVSLLVNLCMDLIHMNFFNNSEVNIRTYIYICVNGVLLFISYLLLFPIEKAFGFTSMVTLVELSNINRPLLRRLSEDAPGTFQHSMQVANLAAAVANVLGAKSQLVRTGALYHDIGKLKNPVFFTENQSGVNPHNKLSFEDSAQIIIQHVHYGLELANKYNLPPDVKQLIATHHGRSKTKFFYISYRNANPDKEVNDEIFTYPGPNPTTMEHAILMMADSVEAASRSLREYTEESISNLVEKIIDSQLQEGYFRQCDITFANIELAKETFKEKLKSIYHTRITYPELKK